MARTVWGRVAGGAAAWAGGVAVLVAAAHPSSCPTVTVDEADAAVEAGVAWIARNQRADGSFLYRYDREADEVAPTYSVVRHAGTLLALEQAAAAGVPRAAEAATAGRAWAQRRLTVLGGGRRALTDDTGATALLTVALVEHRRATGDRDHDDLLASLGRFLASTVTPDGAVEARWDLDLDEPVAGERSPFFTGEVLWALARLHAEFPDQGWADPARRVSTYLATQRDDAERRFPPVSEHWGAYAWDEIAAWPTSLTADEAAYAERQAGLFGLQVRYESQRRTEGITRLTRGPIALAAGVGTLGEGLGGIRRLAARTPALEVDRATVDERLRCVAGLLVERQAEGADPRVDGAWFRLGVTQVDDQQHAISALLAARPVLEAAP